MAHKEVGTTAEGFHSVWLKRQANEDGLGSSTYSGSVQSAFWQADGIGDKYNGRQHPGGYTCAYTITGEKKIWSCYATYRFAIVRDHRGLEFCILEEFEVDS
uniref:(northern house mosquito) hypothetical protein n=1 Tax=Culex pipiens TaxID=7175 RepID=A0A8D8NN36_CULPI